MNDAWVVTGALTMKGQEVQQSQFCEQDGFPLVEINGRILCSAEYADLIIGGQEVTNVREVDGYLYLEFERGASMPLTCPCCGGRLHLNNMSLDQLARMLHGRTLEGFRHGEWVNRAPKPERHPVFALQFAGQEDIDARTIRVHLASVRGIRPE